MRIIIMTATPTFIRVSPHQFTLFRSKSFPQPPNTNDAINKAAQIVFDVFKTRLIGSDDFLKIAQHTIASAIVKGYTCNEIQSIYNAWRAVGIYPNMANAASWLDVGTVLPAACNNTSSYTWDTACGGFTLGL
ncbi:MAG: hypothetical protein IPL33_16860 [Sphingobacteriales bacterium]|nr:hypothetical protein [Sphingobacteriales bacterium]